MQPSRSTAMKTRGQFDVLKVLNDYFGLFVLGAMAAAALAGGLLGHSLGAAALWALGAFGAVILFFILWGPISAVLEAVDGLKAQAAQIGWARTLLRTWALGLVSWTPPHAVLGQFLLAWMLILVATGLWVAPHFAQWSMAGKTAAVAALLALAGAVNGAFRGPR